MAIKSKFIVTNKAGTWVAGQRSPGAGKPIELTERQSEYALIAGEVIRPSAEVTIQPDPETETTTRRRK